MNERWKRIDEIVQAALTRPPVERPAFVRAECGRDQPLCDEILSLLAQEDDAESFLTVSSGADGPPMIGRTIGMYRIDARIGAGGMGVVYRARDMRLERDVAVKILPMAVANDPDALARLGREARLLASISHPRIAAVHGLEETGDVRAIVMELLDGENLAERLARGPLSLADSCRLGAQIADGLAAAHDKGIVHRDLKPANVQITTSGNVKLLDFGIAKAVDGDTGGTTLATREGTLIGTPLYMSPEQLRGEPVDRQTDVWAFGCVLFEMLSGTQTFPGQTTSDIVAAVLERQPAWAALPATLPAHIRTLIRRCLAKDRSQRLRDMVDVRIALEDQLEPHPLTSASDSPSAPARAGSRLAWISAVTIVAAVAIGLPLWHRTPATDTPAMPSTTIKLWLPPGTVWVNGAPGPRITRNGRRVATILKRGEMPSVFVLDLDTGAWREVAGTADSRLLSFSPDGTEVAFIRNNMLMRIAIEGGAPSKICDDADTIRGGDWSEDGRIVFGGLDRGLAIVPATGGVPERITTPDVRSSEADHRYPIWLPGATSILFTVQNSDSLATGIAVTTVGSNTHRLVVRGGRNPAFVDGHLIYVNEADELRAVRFDPVALTAGPRSFALDERPAIGGFTTEMAIRASVRDLVYVPATPPQYHFEILDQQGVPRRLSLPPRPAISEITVSPNGERVVYASVDAQAADLSIFDMLAGSTYQVTTDRNNRWPIWTGDDRIVFTRRGTRRMFALTLGASGRAQGQPQLLGAMQGIPAFVDGDDLVYETFDTSDPNGHLNRTTMSGQGRIERLVEGRGHQCCATLSPDRQWLAYLSTELGEGWDLFVARYTTPLRPRRVIPGAQAIRWSRESNELFYVKADALLATRIDATGSPGEPRRVMAMSTEPGGPDVFPYDTMPGGRLLVAVREPLPQDAHTPVLVLNWMARLRTVIAKQAANDGRQQ